jgi:general secretion pathway protein H
MTTLTSSPPASRESAFTLVELMVAIAIVGLLLAVTVPASMRFYESIQYRQAVRDVLATLGSARQQAMDRGRAQDVTFEPDERRIAFGEDELQLPKGFTLSVTTASEVNRDNLGVIRFYPEGSSTGGDIEINSPVGRGVRITVDWLMGGVSQVSYEAP